MRLLQELVRLNEEVHVIPGNVTSLNGLKSGGKYLAGTVNVAGNVNLYNTDLERLPVRFGAVGGDFYCHKNRLTSLEGAPVTVGGNFDCSNNQLTSLEGVPGSIGGGFYCDENQLTTLEGAPGAVGGNFNCNYNRLTSLVGAHRILRRVGDGLYILDNPIASGGIGLILVKGLTEIYAAHPAFEIIGQYLGQGNKGVLRCQEALHEAGYGEFAKL